MLPLLALAVFVGQSRDDAKVEFETPEQVAAMLGSLNYEYVDSGYRWLEGKLTRDGSTVDVHAIYTDPGPGNMVDGTGGLSLTIEMAFPEEVHPGEAVLKPRWSGPVMPATFLPHLGRTVTARGDIMFADIPTRGSLRRTLGAFWKAVNDYARSHGGRFVAAPEADGVSAVLSDDLMLMYSDEASVYRAIKSWGLMDPDTKTFSRHGWRLPLWVHGAKLTIGGEHDAFGNVGRYLTLSADMELPLGIDPKAWLRTEGKRQAWANFPWSPDRKISPHQEIVLEKGISLGDLRRRIKAFAANIAELEKQINAKVE